MSNGNGQPDGLEVLRKAEAAARARMPQITVADNPNDLLGAMLKYRRQGRSVIPAAGKKPPIDRHGQTMPWRKYQHVPPSESTIRSWLAPGRFPGPITGILLVCGVPLRYEVARDWDKRPPKDEWSESHPDLTHICPTVWTPRGGHVHFRADVGVIEGDDGELKGRGGMVLMPPSLHPDGSRYRWEVPDGELPKLDPKAAGLYPSAQHPIADPSAQHNLKENVAQAFSAVSGVLSVLSVPSVPKCSQDIAAKSRVRDIAEVVSECIPNAIGQRHSYIFKLARALKGHPQTANADAPALKKIFRAWHQKSLPFIGTQGWDTSWADFVEAWENVKFPGGSGPIEAALLRADGDPAPEAAGYEKPELRRLISLCRQLHRQAGGSFYLGCRSGGKAIGIEPMTCSRWLRMLCFDGVLELVKTGEMVIEKDKQPEYRASEYKWKGKL